MLPWPIKWQTFIFFSIGDPTMLNSTSRFTLAYSWTWRFLHLMEPTSSLSSFLMIFDLFVTRVSLLYWKTNCRFIFYWLSCPDCNLVFNCAGLPRCFSSRDSKMENAFPIAIGPRIQLWHSSQWMAYYSRYAIERKFVVFGVPLIRLVTSEP
jgi:hypothetical protein